MSKLRIDKVALVTRAVLTSICLITTGCASNDAASRLSAEVASLKGSINERDQISKHLLGVIEWIVDEAVKRPGNAKEIKSAAKWQAADLEERLALSVVTAMSFKPDLMRQNRQEFCVLALTYAKGVDEVFSDPNTAGLTVQEAFAALSVLLEKKQN